MLVSRKRKRGGPKSAPLLHFIYAEGLKNQLQAQLRGAVAARAQHGVAGRSVRCLAGAAKLAAIGIVESGSVYAGGGEIGVVEHVEEFGSELGLVPLSPRPGFGD